MTIQRESLPVGESDLRIEEHYTDTAGFTDQVFTLMHMLGFRFAPRIRDLGDSKIYLLKGKVRDEALSRSSMEPSTSRPDYEYEEERARLHLLPLW